MFLRHVACLAKPTSSSSLLPPAEEGRKEGRKARKALEMPMVSSERRLEIKVERVSFSPIFSFYNFL